MIEFIETIKILNGRVYNITCHNKRCLATRQQHFQNQRPINLRSKITIPAKYQSGLVKCRVTYSEGINNIEFKSYKIRPIKSLKLIKADHLKYHYKYNDRKEINNLFKKRGKADDILIICNELITDTSYANIALFKKGKWYTPKQPILSGCQRNRLLKAKRIISKEITIADLDKYSHIQIFNSMIPFGSLVCDTRAII